MNTSIAKCVSTVQTVRVLYGAVIEMAAHEVSNVFHRGHFVTVLSPDVTRTADLGGRKRERERTERAQSETEQALHDPGVSKVDYLWTITIFET